MQIFLDFDGTLVDVQSKYYFIYQEFVEAYKGKTMATAEFWDMKKNMDDPSEIIKRSQLTNASAQDLKDFTIARIEQKEALSKDTLLENATQVLATLNQEHSLVLISMRRNYDNLLAQLQELKIAHFFDKVISPFHSGYGKTKLPKYEAIKAYSYQHPALIVGDSGMDIKSGNALEIFSCATLSGIRNKKVLDSYNPSFTIQSIAELPEIVKQTVH